MQYLLQSMFLALWVWSRASGAQEDTTRMQVNLSELPKDMQEIIRESFEDASQEDTQPDYAVIRYEPHELVPIYQANETLAPGTQYTGECQSADEFGGHQIWQLVRFDYKYASDSRCFFRFVLAREGWSHQLVGDTFTIDVFRLPEGSIQHNTSWANKPKVVELLGSVTFNNTDELPDVVARIPCPSSSVAYDSALILRPGDPETPQTYIKWFEELDPLNGAFLYQAAPVS